MSRCRKLAVGLAAGAVLAATLAGCAKSVEGTPEAAASPPNTGTAPNGSGSSSSGNSGSGGSGSGGSATDFCQSIDPTWVAQSFGVSSVLVSKGTPQSAGSVQTETCAVNASGGFTMTVLGLAYPTEAGFTSQSVAQSAQQELTSADNASNLQPLTGIGNADLAFICQVQGGVAGLVLFADKAAQQIIEATEIVVPGSTSQAQLIAFAKLVDNG
ncbi:MAG TPA: hypothetical protein VHX38_09670 [Pseudonocardiaceae bacterium]|jgi:hypothetical protein|nr:hypothetical protein [Pseudonocardiaceae bacterium]